MSSIVRQADTVARVGGDEFVILLNGLSHNKDKAFSACEKMSALLSQSFEKAFMVDGDAYTVSASMGSFVFDKHCLDASEVLRHADTDMYKNKHATKQSIESD